ncbi:unnamed protein product [Trifolium pratense]|uniref:Uncharacterized protein n=1 Tax=Trifolium pratense TaxID=57577 RepID=A0ACB0KAT9_TRIPR|nr:unnamed protein product [Trifolium pratense]
MSFTFTATAQPPSSTTIPPEPPDVGGDGKHLGSGKSTTKMVSFRDKVLGNQALMEREKVDLIATNKAKVELVQGNRLLPMLHVEKSVMAELSVPWKDALVVKLLGKRLGYNTMKAKLENVWKLTGGFELMDVGYSYYMVKFDGEEDKNKVINGGPWMIYDHYLAVSLWSPKFNAATATIDKTMVWIRIPSLNLVYYDESVLWAVASMVGNPVKVDLHTLRVARGKFARMCIEVDLTKPVVGRVGINGDWYRVQYEGLHIICTQCGCYGHLLKDCGMKKKNITVESKEKSGEADGDGGANSTGGEAVQKSGLNQGAINEEININVVQSVKEKDVEPWLLTVVYASPRENERQDTWNLLRDIATTVTGPWLMMGDFNEIAHPEEKKGGAPTNARKCHIFNNWINDCNLLEVTTSGTRFTWRGPKWNGRDRVFKKLDRILCNVDWRLKYPEGFAKVLPRVQSDHHPIIVLLQGENNTNKNRPFRFEAAWTSHADFNNFLHSKWEKDKDIVQSLHELMTHLKKWNKETFGNIFKRKGELLSRLNGIQKSSNYGYSIFLENLEKELQDQLVVTLYQEEYLWFQKSRSIWVSDGDRNTKNFLWGETSQSRKPHLVGWDVCCLPKNEGGLGIKRPHYMNNAFLMKMLWNLINNPDDLWCKVLYGKYGRNDDLRVIIHSQPYDSPLWRALTGIWDQFQQNIVWQLGDGNNINFWLDKWMPGGNSLFSTTNQSFIDTTLSVREVVTPSGDWDYDFLISNLPSNFVFQVLALPAPTDTDGRDSIGWGGTTTRDFTVQSAYVSQSARGQTIEGDWKALWGWKGPYRIQTFMWTAAHERLLTNYRRSKWGVGGINLTENLVCYDWLAGCLDHDYECCMVCLTYSFGSHGKCYHNKCCCDVDRVAECARS